MFEQFLNEVESDLNDWNSGPQDGILKRWHLDWALASEETRQEVSK